VRSRVEATHSPFGLRSKSFSDTGQNSGAPLYRAAMLPVGGSFQPQKQNERVNGTDGEKSHTGGKRYHEPIGTRTVEESSWSTQGQISGEPVKHLAKECGTSKNRN